MFNILVILYYVFCLGYTAAAISKKKENGLIKALLITFLPVVGYILSHYLFKPGRSVRSSQAGEELEGILPLAANVGIYHSINLESEINVVPIQEALLLNDNKIKRKLLIQTLKENSIENTKVLEKALQNDDSETSHYAASAIMEGKRKLLNSMQELASLVEGNPEDDQILSAYADIINQYLKSGFLDEGTYKQYQSLLSTVLEQLLSTEKGQKQHFIDKINCDLALYEYDKCFYYSEKFLKEYPHEEMAYIMAMKLHYTLKNPIQLQKVMLSLKKQPVRLSAHGLSIVRFWL